MYVCTCRQFPCMALWVGNQCLCAPCNVGIRACAGHPHVCVTGVMCSTAEVHQGQPHVWRVLCAPLLHGIHHQGHPRVWLCYVLHCWDRPRPSPCVKGVMCSTAGIHHQGHPHVGYRCLCMLYTKPCFVCMIRYDRHFPQGGPPRWKSRTTAAIVRVWI